MYAEDDEFNEILQKCTNEIFEDYLLHDNFLFNGSQLCIPKSFVSSKSFIV